jgi:hypothetical protein
LIGRFYGWVLDSGMNESGTVYILSALANVANAIAVMVAAWQLLLSQ